MRKDKFELGYTEKTLKRLAKQTVLLSFRNSYLEDLHSGVTPSSKTKDYSDVKVVSPFGEIPWNNLSRLSDKEMKRLMKNVVDQTYIMLKVILEKKTSSSCREWLEKADPLPDWDDPFENK